MAGGTTLSDQNLLYPPGDLPEFQRGVWLALPADDLLVAYLTTQHWPQATPPQGWELARLSQAAFIYRERSTQWGVVVKFYTAKSDTMAETYARQEFDRTVEARAAGLDSGPLRAVEPIALWQGALILEYVNGLTLESAIAVRRHRPGELLPALERTAALLATLHAHSAAIADSGNTTAYTHQIEYAYKLVDQLERWGVLQNNPVIGAGLRRLIEQWAAQPSMTAYTPTLIHGDATTTNFVSPWDGGMVAIDWERAKLGDPAADLGRLLAEISHGLSQQGGNVAEADPLLDLITETYCRHRADLDTAEHGVQERVRFHRAVSTLRIARNGWLSRLDRTALVAEALALLAGP